MVADDEVIRCELTDRVLRCVDWAERFLGVDLLILYVRSNFSKNRTVSYVSPGLLQYHVVFSLWEIANLKRSGVSGWFYENQVRTNQFGGIGTFVGGWKEHLAALVDHEMAHVFESMASLEPLSKSKINEFYGHAAKRSRYHHNLLWRKIYRDLKNREDTYKSANTVLVPTDGGFNLYKSGSINEI